MALVEKTRQRIKERRSQVRSQLYAIKYKLNPVTSGEVGIKAGGAFAHILAFNTWGLAEEGNVIDANVLLENTGDTGVDMDVNFWWVNANLYGGAFEQDQGWSGRQWMAPGDKKWFYKPNLLTMPAGDVWARARSHIFTGWPWEPGTWSEDSDATIEFLKLVNTALTLAVSPTSVVKGGAFTCSGRLTRNDTGAGVSAANITVQFLIGGAWQDQKSAATDADGNFTCAVTAPSTSGSYSVRATYGGSSIFGQTVSGQTMLGVGVGNIPSLRVNAYCQEAPMLIRNNYYRAKKLGLVNVQKKLEDLATRQGYSLV